jgi:hypothetical protein
MSYVRRLGDASDDSDLSSATSGGDVTAGIVWFLALAFGGWVFYMAATDKPKPRALPKTPAGKESAALLALTPPPKKKAANTFRFR